MNTVPIPVRKLLLCVSFDLSDVPNATLESLRGGELDHGALVRLAAGASHLIDPSLCAASCITVSGPLSIDTVQSLPFAHTESHIEYSFVYSSTVPASVLRVLVSLEKCDGVTALRVGLHAMELLENGADASKLADTDAFTKPPHIQYGLRHVLNFGRMIQRTLTSIAFAQVFGFWMDRTGAARALGYDKKSNVVVPTTAASVLEYYKQGTKGPLTTTTSLFTATADVRSPYRGFLNAIEKWRLQLNLRACFVLCNQSPLVIPAEVAKVTDIADDRSFAKRYAGAFDRPSQPPGEDIWPMNNFYHCGVVFVNNYGKHAHRFNAKALKFKWDWLGLGAHCWGAGCLDVNGVFMAWVRGTEEGVLACETPLAAALGRGVVDKVAQAARAVARQ